MAIHGLVLLTPTDTDNASGTVSIGANGTVTFTTVPDLRVNGIFSSLYTNYMMVVNCTTSASTQILGRIASGDTDSTASSYHYSAFAASATTLTITNTATQSTSVLTDTASGDYTSFVLSIYGPYETAASNSTATWRTLAVRTTSGATQSDYSTFHNVATAYDSFNLYTGTGTMTGTLRIYGWRT